MIDHLSTYPIDFEKTKAFYAAALAALGNGAQFEMKLDDDPDLPGRRIGRLSPGTSGEADRRREEKREWKGAHHGATSLGWENRAFKLGRESHVNNECLEHR